MYLLAFEGIAGDCSCREMNYFSTLMSRYNLKHSSSRFAVNEFEGGIGNKDPPVLFDETFSRAISSCLAI